MTKNNASVTNFNSRKYFTPSYISR